MFATALSVPANMIDIRIEPAGAPGAKDAPSGPRPPYRGGKGPPSGPRPPHRGAPPLHKNNKAKRKPNG